MSVACVVVATERRKALVNNHIVPSIRDQAFDEVIVTADYQDRNVNLYIPSRHHNTLDALVRKQAALEATVSDVVCYVSDDHYPDDRFLGGLLGRLDDTWDILCPWRYTVRDGSVISLNTGKDGLPDGGRDYVAGHAGIYRRSVLETVSWADIYRKALTIGDNASALFYDTWGTHLMVDSGSTLCYCDEGDDVAVVDIDWHLDPGSKPWL